MKKLLYLLLIPVSILSACKKDDPVDANGLAGEWQWEQTYGGLIGETITPASSGDTKRLEIDADTYKEFKNNALIFESQYVLATRPDSLFGTNKVIEFETGYELAVLQSGDDLKLIEICFDCYEHTYVRE